MCARERGSRERVRERECLRGIERERRVHVALKISRVSPPPQFTPILFSSPAPDFLLAKKKPLLK